MIKIDVYSISWNEKIILPYFIKHYGQFARKIVVYDNMSSDGSVELMKDNNIQVIPFDTGEKYSELEQVNIRNNCWKGSDADWVIVCDIDEFIHHKNLLKYLTETECTQLFPRGYEMMSENLPNTDGQIYDEIKMGYPIDEFMYYNVYPHWKSNYSKGIIFKPTEISETNFGLGSHYCEPIGNIKTNIEGYSKEDKDGRIYPIVKDELKLLHYKYLNREYVISKNRTMRQSQNFLEKEINQQYDAWLPFCKKVID